MKTRRRLLVVLASLLAVEGCRESGSPAPSRDAASRGAPTGSTSPAWPRPAAKGRADPPLVEPAFTPPEAISSWPVLQGEKRVELERGRELLAEASRLYAQGVPAALLAGDRAMLAALDTLYRAGAVVPELRAFHHETVMRPLAAGDRAAAEERLRFWLRSFPDDPYALRLLAAARLNSDDAVSALPVLARWLALRPNDVEALSLQARALYRLRRWSDAMPFARRHADLVPEDLDAHRLVAEIGQEMGDQESAVAAVHDALAVIAYPTNASLDAPQAERVFSTAIKVLHRFREYRDLAPLAAFWRTRHPEDLDAITAEGVARLETGDAVGAIPLLERALESPPNREELLYSLGVALARAGRHEEALRNLAKLLVESPHHAKAFYQLGLTLARLDRRAEAEAMLRRARELGPNEREDRRVREHTGVGRFADALVARVRAALLRDEHLEALAALDEPAARSTPAAAPLRVEVLLAALRGEDAERAIDALAGQVGASSIDVVGSRAQLEQLRGETARAIERLSSALDRSPNERWSFELARWQLELGRAEDAAARLAPLRRGPEDREASLLLGQARLALGDPAAALKLLDSISSGDTRAANWEIDAWTARAAAAAGHISRALELAARAGAERPGRLGTRRAELAARRANFAAGSAQGSDEETARRREALADAERALSRYESLLPEISRVRREITSTAWNHSSPARAQLSTLYLQAGDRALALESARRACEADPKSAASWAARVAALAGDADVFERMLALRSLVRLDANDDARRETLRALEARWLGSGSAP